MVGFWDREAAVAKLEHDQGRGLHEKREREFSELFAILSEINYGQFLLTFLGLYGYEMKQKLMFLLI